MEINKGLINRLLIQGRTECFMAVAAQQNYCVVKRRPRLLFLVPYTPNSVDRRSYTNGISATVNSVTTSFAYIHTEAVPANRRRIPNSIFHFYSQARKTLFRINTDGHVQRHV